MAEGVKTVVLDVRAAAAAPQALLRRDLCDLGRPGVLGRIVGCAPRRACYLDRSSCFIVPISAVWLVTMAAAISWAGGKAPELCSFLAMETAPS